MPDAASCREARARLANSRAVDPGLRAAVYDNLSALSQSQGDLTQAASLAVAAVSAAEGLGTPEPLWRAYLRTARVLHAQARAPLAIFFGKRALAQIERERRSISAEDERLDRGFLRDRIDVYRSVADWLMELARFDEALEVLQLLKAQELYDFVSRDGAFRMPGGGPALDALESTLTDAYAATLPDDASAGAEIERLNRLKASGRITAAERRRLQSLLQNASQSEAARTARIRRFIARNSQPNEDVPAARAIDAASLRQAVQSAPADAAVAFYLMAEKHLRILVATRRSQTEVVIPIDAPALQREIGRFLEVMGKRGAIEAGARSLYDTLARPVDEIARREGLTRLVLWLDGSLRYVPFSALRSATGYLGERYAIEMLSRNGLDTRVEAGAPSAAALPSVRGFGVTQAVAGYEPLPGMADELCSVVHGPIAGLRPSCDGALAGEGFANAEFTAARFARLLQPPHAYSVLHVGTHFSLRPGNALRSYLVLGDGSRLMLDALSALDFTGLELVTLSACQTAMGGGRTDDGREIEGLSAIVQRRGARQVVASLWRVEDASTAQLMRAMYGALVRNPPDVAAALRDAQQSVRAIEHDGVRPFEHPYYWAGFVITGTAASASARTSRR
jgi:CHAT domain-containing protein